MRSTSNPNSDGKNLCLIEKKTQIIENKKIKYELRITPINKREIINRPAMKIGDLTHQSTIK